MGKDHVNSNDNGKGADIFNDVPGMIEKVLRKIEAGIEQLETLDNGYDKWEEKMNLRAFATTKIKINQLKKTTAAFNEKRENKLYRTADGGSGDPDNADKFSNLSKKTLERIDRLSSPGSWNDVRELSRMRHSDWKDLTECRKLRDDEYVKANTFDSMAHSARKKSLQSGDRKLLSGFESWYNESMELLLRTFKELVDVIEHFRQTKNTLMREKKI